MDAAKRITNITSGTVPKTGERTIAIEYDDGAYERFFAGTPGACLDWLNQLFWADPAPAQPALPMTLAGYIADEHAPWDDSPEAQQRRTEDDAR